MAVKVLIKRKVSADKNKELDLLLRKLRALTLNQRGYISGETFTRLDQQGVSLVISTWQNMDAWKSWQTNRKRTEIQKKIDALLGVPTKYEAYEYL